jgi:hypothetical protein
MTKTAIVEIDEGSRAGRVAHQQLSSPYQGGVLIIQLILFELPNIVWPPDHHCAPTLAYSKKITH